ncbi:MAG: alpha/beta hydrolase [Pseudomonadota bacterium]
MFAKRRFGESVELPARAAISNAVAYPSARVFMNPLIRPVARRIINGDWASRLGNLDFEYTLRETRRAGVECLEMVAGRRRADGPVALYVHGGAFCAGSPAANAAAVLPTLHLTGGVGVGVDYAKAPEQVFPRAIEEIEGVYRDLLANGADPKRIVVFAESAGGNLALSSLIAWRDAGLALPAATILFSPSIDANFSSDSSLTQHSVDPFVKNLRRDQFAAMFDLYAPGMDRDDPRISPIRGDLSGLPPLLIQAGTREILLGDSVRLAETAREHGVNVELRIFDGMFHLFHMHWDLREGRRAHANAAAFIERVFAAA